MSFIQDNYKLSLIKVLSGKEGKEVNEFTTVLKKQTESGQRQKGCWEGRRKTRREVR